jgi:hypothetical protein
MLGNHDILKVRKTVAAQVSALEERNVVVRMALCLHCVALTRRKACTRVSFKISFQRETETN